MASKDQTASDKKVAVDISERAIKSLMHEFDIQQEDMSNFVTMLIERAVADHAAQSNSKIFTESETKEIEDDLKGLGYI
jgi:hypothetical protein